MDKRMDGWEEEWPHEIGLNEMREGMGVGMGTKKEVGRWMTHLPPSTRRADQALCKAAHMLR